MKDDQKWALVEIEEKILDLFLSSPSRILSTDESDLLVDLKKHKDDIISMEFASIWLKSQAIWMALGDTNSKFFHQYASAHQNFNTVWDLEDHLGNPITNEDALLAEGKRHFA